MRLLCGRDRGFRESPPIMHRIKIYFSGAIRGTRSIPSRLIEGYKLPSGGWNGSNVATFRLTAMYSFSVCLFVCLSVTFRLRQHIDANGGGRTTPVPPSNFHCKIARVMSHLQNDFTWRHGDNTSKMEQQYFHFHGVTSTFRPDVSSGEKATDDPKLPKLSNGMHAHPICQFYDPYRAEDPIVIVLRCFLFAGISISSGGRQSTNHIFRRMTSTRGAPRRRQYMG